MPEFIPVANPIFQEEDAKAVYDVIKSGWISMGKKVEAFENLICDYTGSKYAVAMNNGTSTLHSILMSLEIGPGDEVIIPSLTYISSANSILYTGATPVLCDSDPLTFNVSPENIREKISKKTKAFMTVDMKGMPVDYDSLLDLSKETGLPFISDSAESLGASYKNEKVGSQALASSFSFFANKNITTGEGGMIVTDDKNIYDRLRIIRNQGQEGRYNHTYLGYNYRMTDIQAALGISQLNRIDTIIYEKNKLADYYSNVFDELSWIKKPYVPDYVSNHSWYNYSITVDASIRNDLIKYLDKNKIETRLSFPPIHIQPYYVNKYGYHTHYLENAYQAFESFIDLPIWKGLE